MNEVSGRSDAVVRTVLGDIEPAALGLTLAHEHLVVDLHAFIHSYDAIVHDVDMLIDELRIFKQSGGDAIIDVTSLGLGRSSAALVKISRATGVHLVMGSGWYRERVYPAYIKETSVNNLAEMISRDIREGVDGTNVRAGVIGEIGTERYPVSPAQERVFRAAARAHHLTNAPITTHTTHFGSLAHEQLDLFEEEGVDLQRVIVGHLGDRRDLSMLVEIAERGAWVQVDKIGRLSDQRDEVRAENIVGLVTRGFGDKVLLSMDNCLNSHLHYFGGHGFDYVSKSFVPLLRATDLQAREIEKLLIDNPRNAFSFYPH